MPKKQTKIAICYDFDGTLIKGNIQENSFLPELGVDKKKFWKEVNEHCQKHEMDQILAYMYLLIAKAKTAGVKMRKETIKEHGKDVKYFKGVESFFKRIKDYAKEKNIVVEHYIISSGTKEMIEGTSIKKHFKQIYASSFKYDHNDIPEWPAIAINYTTKVQYLFRVNKGIKNVWDNDDVNKYMPEDKKRIPFRNIIYIGDGSTDIPAMKMVNYQGGTSIAVYAPNTKGAKDKVKELIQQKRASYIAEADYSESSTIDKIIKSKIDQISAFEAIEKFKK